MKIRLLGTGAGYPDPFRNNSSLLIEGKISGLLIDTGEGVASSLQKKGIWKQKIESIIITHNHADHVSGLAMLLQGWKGDRRHESLEIIAPSMICRMLPEWLSMIRIGPDKLPFELDIKELIEGEFRTSSGHEVSAWTNGHIPEDDNGQSGSYSLNIGYNNKNCLISSDIPDLKILKKHLKNVNALIVETTHIDYQEAVEMAKSYKVEHVLLTHIPINAECIPIEAAVWVEDNQIVEI